MRFSLFFHLAALAALGAPALGAPAPAQPPAANDVAALAARGVEEAPILEPRRDAGLHCSGVCTQLSARMATRISRPFRLASMLICRGVLAFAFRPRSLRLRKVVYYKLRKSFVPELDLDLDLLRPLRVSGAHRSWQ